MNKIFTGIFTAILVAGIVGIYFPNASATLLLERETCSGNSALAQDGSNSAEQNPLQEQANDYGAQSVVPEFNALTGNNLNLNDQQNGECGFELPGSPVPQSNPLASEDENTIATTTALQNSTE